MIPVKTCAGRTVAVFGLGASGLATAQALAAGGARVLAWDDTEDARNRAIETGIAIADLTVTDLSDVSALVLSPGVPLTHPAPHPVAKRARASGIEVIGDTELFFREIAAAGLDTPVVCVTGTNGKSTTTAMIGHILKSAGRDAQIGGNIGHAVLDLAPPAAGRHYVLELSSYQIDLSPGTHPQVGVLLNLSPDHLDRHGSMANYAGVKARMFAGQGRGDTAVIGLDDVHAAAIAERVGHHARLLPISVTHDLEDGVCAGNGLLREMAGGAVTAEVPLAGVPALRGAHNWQNAAAAYAACRALGLEPDAIAAGLRGFPGLAHRMEEVGRRERVLFVNDSKATNAEAAARALAAFDRIYWIVGGLPKAGGVETLRSYFPRIARAYLIGKAAGDFAKSFDGAIDYVVSGTLGAAVAQAARDAAADTGEEPVVLLSPGCASFDQFRNFEVRGDAFRDAVRALEGVRSSRGEAA